MTVIVTPPSELVRADEISSEAVFGPVSKELTRKKMPILEATTIIRDTRASRRDLIEFVPESINYLNYICC